MRKDKLYFLTFISVTLIYILVMLVAINFFTKETSRALMASQLELGKKETKTFALIIGQAFQNNIAKEQVVSQLQQSVGGTQGEKVFLSVIDWSGKIICHPEIKNVGQTVGTEQSFVSSVADNLGVNEFYDLFMERVRSDTKKTEGSEVIFMYPIENSDWIAVANANLKPIEEQINALKLRFYSIFAIIGLAIIPSFVIVTRYIGSIYEKRLEQQKQKLEDEVLSLSKLNRAVGDYQQKVSKEEDVSSAKKRILTQRRNELLSVPIEEIAHIYTENTITYVVGFDGKKSTTNVSLDELHSQLDESVFFRANRQFIIAISSIDKIVKYGNNQLKILVTPETNSDILISKNKAAEFKNWLNL